MGERFDPHPVAIEQARREWQHGKSDRQSSIDRILYEIACGNQGLNEPISGRPHDAGVDRDVRHAHGGGFTPYQAARWEHGWAVRPEPKKNVPEQPKNIAGRFYYDTILHSDKTLEAMIGLTGVSRVLLGSDTHMTWR